VTHEIMITAANAQANIDNETVAYILVARKHFEDLRQVAAQLAGLLVLAAAGGKSATPDHPMIEAAAQLHASASDGIRNARATPRARAHHECLSRAEVALECALASARTSLGRAALSSEIESILTPLKAAYSQLQFASAALPGFETISFNQACCAPPANSSKKVMTTI
jgi:hypothetical protein